MYERLNSTHAGEFTFESFKAIADKKNDLVLLQKYDKLNRRVMVHTIAVNL